MHKTVLQVETISPLAGSACRVMVDCTFGGGGHSRAMLERFPQAQVVAFDKDSSILELAKTNFSEELRTGRLRLIHADFSSIAEKLAELSLTGIDGLVADLGVSSFQIDTAARGFSFLRAGPLDMRMNPEAALSAREIVNEWPQAELERIFFAYGEERFSKKIVRRILESRSVAPIVDTLALAKLTESAVPRQYGKHSIHPATRVFQALRIAVNGELEALEALLKAIPDVLLPSGVASIISFHSLEDRQVKERFKYLSADCICPPVILSCPRCHKPPGRLLTKKPIEASEAELAQNPRSRSAKLRVFQKNSG